MNDNVKRYPNCHMRTTLGNCDPIGGFCTSVNESVCEALHKVSRPQGEWLKFGLGRGTRILFCTNCERRIEVPLSQGDSNYDFCPNCGAIMKGADDE